MYLESDTKVYGVIVRVKRQHKKVRQAKSKIMRAMGGRDSRARQHRGNTGALEHDSSSDRPPLVVGGIPGHTVVRQGTLMLT